MSMAIFNSYVTKYQRVFINIIFKTVYLGLVYVSMKMAKMRDVAHVLSMFVFALGEHRFSVLVMFVIIYIYNIYIYVQMFVSGANRLSSFLTNYISFGVATLDPYPCEKPVIAGSKNETFRFVVRSLGLPTGDLGLEIVHFCTIY